MADDKQQNNPGNILHELPPDEELFSGRVYEELTEKDIFAGDDDFYRFLTESIFDEVSKTPHNQTVYNEPALLPSLPKGFINLQRVIAAAIILIAAVMIYSFLYLIKQGHGLNPPVAVTPQDTTQQSPIKDTAQQTAPQPITTNPLQTPLQRPAENPLSLETAQKYYYQQDYENAYDVYEKLLHEVSDGTSQSLLGDFLQLRMAMCMINKSDSWDKDATVNADDTIHQLLKTASQSQSPVVNAIANYHLSLIEREKTNFLKAATRAYKTLAIIEAVQDRDFVMSMQQECSFLAGECLTRYVLLLGDADKDMPRSLWGKYKEADPFANIDKTKLKELLESGIRPLKESLLGPEISRISDMDGPVRFSVVCSRATIEEMLSRLASNTKHNISWVFSDPGDSSQQSIRNRPVTMYMPQATAQQLAVISAGSAGLIARINESADDRESMIYDPLQYSSLSEHMDVMNKQAIDIWQSFLLVFHSDTRIANVHFAIGMLMSCSEQQPDAISEFKFVANRFAQTSIAPYALLHSSRIKTSLLDYAGAKTDLEQLIGQYPDSEISDEAILYLADATMQAGRYDEAVRLYKKVYNLDLSLSSQIKAALGAGKCSYKISDYQNGQMWLGRYIELVRNNSQYHGKELYSTQYLLGRICLSMQEPAKACVALESALKGSLARDEYTGAVSLLARAYKANENYVAALYVIENIHEESFTENELIELQLIRADILRSIGLVDKAIAILDGKGEYITDTNLKAKVLFELAKCQIAKENLNAARENLAMIMTFTQSGPIVHEAAVELAAVCYELDMDSQVISVCSQLLDLKPSKQIRQKALELLSAAYNRQKNYNMAAIALLGKWSKADMSKEKIIQE